MQADGLPAALASLLSQHSRVLVDLDGLPLAPSVNEALRKTPTDRKKAAERRRQFYRDVGWLARKAKAVGAFDRAGQIAALVQFAPARASALGDVDNRCKALLDALTKAQVWQDDRHVNVLMVVRLPAEPPHGRTHVTAGVWR